MQSPTRTTLPAPNPVPWIGRAPILARAVAHGVLLLVLALGTWSCGGDDDGGAGPDQDDDGPFTAKVDGQSWVPDPIGIFAIGGGGPGAFTIGGTQNVNGVSTTITLLLWNIKEPGTYPLGTNSFVFGGRAQFSSSGAVWATPNDGTAGTLVLTVLQPGRIAGTFEYRAEASNDEATGTHLITEGEFDLPLTGTIVPVPDHMGNSVTAVIGDEEYIAYSVNADGATGIVFDSNTEKWSVALRLDGVDEAGVYTLTETMPWRFVTLRGPCNGVSGEECIWRAVNLEDGTVTVESVTSTRAKGTFAVVVRPEDGEPASDVTMTGTFDIGMQ